MSELCRRLLALFRRRDRLDRELEEEMRCHLEMQAEENHASGMPPEEAGYAAHRQFGNGTLLHETSREVWGIRWLETLVQDVRYGLRGLRRNPGFTAAAVLTVALGVGAATAVFSVAYTVILRPLPFPQPERVMTVLAAYDTKPAEPMEYLYTDWRDRQRCFEAFAGGRWSLAVYRGPDDARQIRVAYAGADFFRLAGAQLSVGRVFTRQEDQTGHDGVAVLDNAFWRREFGGNPGVLGRSINLDGRERTIIGVLPPDVRFPGFGRCDIWVPLAARYLPNGGGYGRICVVGRLRAGLTRERAQAEMDVVTRQVHLARPRFGTIAAVVVPLREWLAGDVHTIFLALAGAAAFLLLIGCANLANLLLARGSSRAREFALRASLRAGRRRLALQMFTESLLLAVLGGLAGILLAVAAVRAVPAIRGIDIPRVEEIAVDYRFLLIGIGVSLASGILFGLAPAFDAGRRDLVAAMYSGDAPAGRFAGKFVRHALIGVQMALVMVLLSGAGLLTNSLLRLLNVNLGFTRSDVFQVKPALTPKLRMLDRAARAQCLRELADRVRSMPGVESASVANLAPLQDVHGGYVLVNMRDGTEYKVDALGRDVDPGYFSTTGIPLLAGRDFTPADASQKPVPVILNREAARALFGGRDPLGNLLRCTENRIGMMQVIGIVGDAHMLGVARDPGPQAFAPLMGGWGYASVVVARGGVKPASLVPAIRTAVRELDPGAPPPVVTALDEIFADEVAKPRFYMALVGSFAVLGLILAAVGVYGVVAYAVGRRTREFGIRLALGALPANIVRMIVASNARVVFAGAIAGLAGALAATRLLESLLFQVKPRDPLTFAAMAAVLIAIALAAAWLAARRASRIDPMEALRHD